MDFLIYFFGGTIITIGLIVLWRRFDRWQTKQAHAFMDRAGLELEQIAQEAEDKTREKDE